MGIVQKDAFKTTLISYVGIGLGYINKGFLFIILFQDEQFGLINLILTVGILFAQLANLGTVSTTWKFLPFFKNEDKRHHGFFALMFYMVVTGILFCSIFAFLFRIPIQSFYVEKSAAFVQNYYLIFPIGIGYALFLFFEVYLRGFYKNILAVVSFELILRVVVSFLLVGYYLNWLSFDSFLVYHSLAYLIPAIILTIYLFRMGELNLSPRSIQIKNSFKRILIQFTAFNYINSLAATVVVSLDAMMVASMLGLDETGIYTSVVFITSALLVPYRSIIRISSPLVADYWKHREMDKMKEIYVKVSSVSLFIGLTVFMLLWMNIDIIINLLPEDKRIAFQPGIWVFFFLMIGRLLDMFFGLNGAIFMTSKKYKYDIIFTISLVILVFVLNILFIPIWGMIGAAISTAIALIVYNLGRVIFVWKTLHLHPFTKNQFIIIGLTIVILISWSFVGRFIENEILRVLCSVIYFFGGFLIPIFLFNLEHESTQFMMKLWKRFKHSIS